MGTRAVVARCGCQRVGRKRRVADTGVATNPSRVSLEFARVDNCGCFWCAESTRDDYALRKPIESGRHMTTGVTIGRDRCLNQRTAKETTICSRELNRRSSLKARHTPPRPRRGGSSSNDLKTTTGRDANRAVGTGRSVETATGRGAPRALFLKGTFGFEMHLMV